MSHALNETDPRMQRREDVVAPAVAKALAEGLSVTTGPHAVPIDLTAPTPPRTRVVLQKVGRNERCPCGSERKFKRCCLNKRVEPARKESADEYAVPKE